MCRSGEGVWASSFLSWSVVRWMVSSSSGGRGAGRVGGGTEGGGWVCSPLGRWHSSSGDGLGTILGGKD